MGIVEVVVWCDVIMFIMFDEFQVEIYKKYVYDNICLGVVIVFVYGLNVYFGLIELKEGVDVIMMVLKGLGYIVCGEYIKGGGVFCFVVVDIDVIGKVFEIVLLYCLVIGGGCLGIIEINFCEECEIDFFGEQVVLCGGFVELICCGFEILVEVGYVLEMVYFECLYEVKLIVDLIYEGGIVNMDYLILNIVEYGQYVIGLCILLYEQIKVVMKVVLIDI